MTLYYFEGLTLADRNQVQVKMRDILSTCFAISAENVDRLRADRAPQPGRDALGHRHTVCEQVFRQVKKRFVVVLRDDQRMTMAGRLHVQKGDRALVLIDYADHFLAADNPAENARFFHSPPPVHTLLPPKLAAFSQLCTLHSRG